MFLFLEEHVLLIFSLRKLIWWKIYLSEPSIFSIPIRTDFLAISKVSPELFITGKDQLDVFSLNLEPIRQMEEPLAYEVEVIIIFLMRHSDACAIKKDIFELKIANCHICGNSFFVNLKTKFEFSYYHVST